MKTKFLIVPMICLAVVLAVIFFAFIFKGLNNTDNIPVIENNILTPEPKPTEKPKPNGNEDLEIYKSELFIEAKWGSENGEVGLLNPYAAGDNVGDAGPIYGPQSFDINDSDNHLFLLDSINERIIEYDEAGKYLRDFLIGYGGTTDIKIQGEYIYILSFGSDAVYKHDMSGKMLDSHSVVPEKNPGIGKGGIEFDENGNIMVEINIDGYYNEESRFYEIGKNGDEWKTNSYNGNITRDKKGFYFVKGVDWLTREVQIKDRSGEIQKEFTIKLPQKAYVYYRGYDKEGNIYLKIGFKEPIIENGFYSDKFIFKYNKEGKLFAKIDLFTPLRKFFKDDELLAIPRIYLYADDFKYLRVSRIGDIYWMATFKNEGLKIFKYSQINKEGK